MAESGSYPILVLPLGDLNPCAMYLKYEVNFIRYVDVYCNPYCINDLANLHWPSRFAEKIDVH